MRNLYYHNIKSEGENMHDENKYVTSQKALK
jgi:hypothetical protein